MVFDLGFVTSDSSPSDTGVDVFSATALPFPASRCMSSNEDGFSEPSSVEPTSSETAGNREDSSSGRGSTKDNIWKSRRGVGEREGVNPSAGIGERKD